MIIIVDWNQTLQHIFKAKITNFEIRDFHCETKHMNLHFKWVASICFVVLLLL